MVLIFLLFIGILTKNPTFTYSLNEFIDYENNYPLSRYNEKTSLIRFHY